MLFPDLLQFFLSLGFVGPLVALLVNMLKSAGLIKDGQSVTWSTGLNVALFVAVFALGIVKPGVDLQALDPGLQEAVTATATLFTFMLNLGLSKFMHNLVKGVPFIGKSYTEEAKAKMIASVSPMAKGNKAV